MPDRRDFLGLLLGGAAGFALPSTAFGQRPAAVAAAPLSAIPLSDSLIHVSGAGGNVIAAVGPESVLMVNGGPEAQSGALARYSLSPSSLFAGMPLRTADWCVLSEVLRSSN